MINQPAFFVIQKDCSDDIVEAAFQLVSREGFDHLNARSLARNLGCSTQPIFSCFASMEELKTAVFGKAAELYNAGVKEGMKNPIPFKGIGLAYISFAKNQPVLFKTLFMSKRDKRIVFDGIDSNSGNDIIKVVQEGTGLNNESAKLFFKEMWIVTHGIAALIATEALSFTDEEISTILDDAFLGILDRFRKKGNK